MTFKGSFLQKASVALSGLFLALLLVELALRAGGAALLAAQERRNGAAVKKGGDYRILCLGESTTQGQYPPFLEAALNQSGAGPRFVVIDEGKGATNTEAILGRVEPLLDKYHPDMVVAMMGMNDPGEPHLLYEAASGSRVISFLKSLSTYKLARLLFRMSQKENSWALPEEAGQRVDMYGESASAAGRNPKDAAAVSVLEKELSSDPADLPAAVKLGKIFLRQGRYGRAEALFKKALELEPGGEEGLVGLGAVYTEQARFEQAEGLLKWALRAHPAGAGAYAGLGALSLLKGEDRRAEGYLKEALRLEPGNARACTLLGQLYAKQGLFPQAEARFEQALRLDPENYKGYETLGRAYVEQGRLERAEEVFKRAIGVNPRDDRGHAMLGLLYLLRGGREPAGEEFEKALRLNPANDIASLGQGVLRRAATGGDGAHSWLGLLCLRPGWSRPAEEELKEAVRLAPMDGMSQFLLGRLYLERGSPREAEEHFTKALRINPRDDKAYAGLEFLRRGRAKAQYRETPWPESVGYNAVTAHNYLALKALLDRRKVRLVCVQYPMRSSAPLKSLLAGAGDGVILVDNSGLFRAAVDKDGYKAYFRDMCGGDFGHCTPKGNKLLGENIARAILSAAFAAPGR